MKNIKMINFQKIKLLKTLFASGRSSKRFLKDITRFLASKGQHFLYEMILKRYDRHLSFTFSSESSQKKFLGTGFGANSLNTYRKLKVGENSLFEKIYFKESIDYKKCCFFYEHINEEASQQGIQTPTLVHKEEGKKLAVLYFEFVDLATNNEIEKNAFSRAFTIMESISKIELPSQFRMKDFLYDFSSDPMITERVTRISKEIEEINPQNASLVKDFLNILQSEERQLQHGDLFRDNFNKEYVVDWDRFGFYPYGHDLGQIISFYRLRDKKEPVEPEDVMTEIEKMGIYEKKEVLNVYFFSILFLCHRDPENRNNCDFNLLVDFFRHLEKKEFLLNT